MSAHNQKSAFPSYYHDTWTLLKNYRSVSWSIEVSDYNLQAEFRTEYGCASEAVLDGLEASNSNTHLESYVHSLERSKRMLQLINSAIDLMRKKHEKGELYYWILYYTYLQQSNNHGNLKCSPKEIFLINITQSKETFVNTVHCQSTDENHSFSLL